jgi:hypothetical protein
MPALFEIVRGDDHAIRLTIKDDLGNPIPITGWAFSVTLKLHSEISDDDAPVKVDTGALDDTDAANGIVNILLPSSQTQNLLPTTYLFDIQREAYDTVITVLVGDVDVIADATRRTTA